MIQYALRCDQGHDFDSWFQSAAAFDALKGSGHISCAICGSGEVDKAIMAPRVSVPATATKTEGALSKPSSDSETAIADLRRHLEENADYVGPRFAEEARSMYLGTTPERAIYGEANTAEAKQLIEDGVPVAPLPFRPTRKAN
ncbi:hypothetical protein So717_32950 [Roseobacter cerasinus]|uniref:DUF1178 family protein n=1 Tax=Roseobacter cerasinus TaxID=2602289 RepID=A0A640VV55_9RHOB|nr:DUF1178 family protein [Roseobacter cerasinus]GFE51542.1 hypothetical protein So717_32950 [Roseobacter cerasinus]